MTAKTTMGRTTALCALICCALLAWTSQAIAVGPGAVTMTGTATGPTTGTLYGSIKTDSIPTDCHFEYVPVAQYRTDLFNSVTLAEQVPCSQALGSISVGTFNPTRVSADVVLPAPDPTLVFRLVATNASGTASGSAVTFAGQNAFDVTSFDGGTFAQNGDADTQAGAHPNLASTDFLLSAVPLGSVGLAPTGDLKDVIIDLPPGLVGNPTGVPACSETSIALVQPTCSLASQVGYVRVTFSSTGGLYGYAPLFVMQAPRGKAALLGFNFGGAVFHITGELRRDDSVAGHYRIRVNTLNAPQVFFFTGAGAGVWGVPADPAYNPQRGWTGDFGDPACADPEKTGKQLGASYDCRNTPSPNYPANVKPFFTLPTSCEGPVQTDVTTTSWQGDTDSASFLSHVNGNPFDTVGNIGCNTLDFSPTLEARPTTNIADSPSGLDVDLHVPQHETCNPGPPVVCPPAEAHLKDTTVTLPEGMTINPSSANGLDACSPAQVDLEGQGPANCPDASKVATVEVDTPLLDHPVEGAAYIAQPHNNPFNSLLALYIALDDPQSGTVVKVAGEVQPDPVTGQLTATFEENPQVPFEDFKLHFKGGAHGTLRTPATCGQYSTTSSLTPWSAPDSGPPATPSDTWAIEQGPGGNCATDAASLPNSPSFDAGTVSPIAGAKTPLVVNLRRADGTQQLHSLTLSPPQGLVGKLAGIPYCSQASLDEAASKSGRAEEASPSCPQASYVGSVTAAAGAGPSPYYAPGKAYLTAPYKGAPLSIAIVTPATAGPFDLGTIVVKTALYVDRTTAQITAVSDPIPSILQGIPLDVRSVQVKMDRPDFTLNPTSCDPSTFGGQLMSTLGQSAPLQSRFQVGECGRLGFKPQLTLALKGATKRTGHPALTATMTMPEGGANLAAISVALPHSEFLDQSHIGTVCTRVQFKADQCPAASVYGTVQVQTPLLDYPLTGNVYLRSSDNPLPDLVPDLRGPAFQPIALEADGRVDSVKGGIRNTFDFVPDAPFSKLVLSMQGGRKGLLENSTNLCAKPQRATVNYTAHNGVTLTAKPALKVKCSKAKKHKKAKRQRHKRRR